MFDNQCRAWVCAGRTPWHTHFLTLNRGTVLAQNYSVENLSVHVTPPTVLHRSTKTPAVWCSVNLSIHNCRVTKRLYLSRQPVQDISTIVASSSCKVCGERVIRLQCMRLCNLMWSNKQDRDDWQWCGQPYSISRHSMVDIQGRGSWQVLRAGKVGHIWSITSEWPLHKHMQKQRQLTHHIIHTKVSSRLPGCITPSFPYPGTAGEEPGSYNDKVCLRSSRSVRNVVSWVEFREFPYK